MNLNIDLKGGKIVFNDFNIKNNIDLKEQPFELQEDLLQVKYPKGYILDLGWYPELDPLGNFKIFVIKDSNWSHPLLEIDCALDNLIKELQRAINFIVIQ